ncbi:hypothetical protein [Enhygromyxa salina]|uniref:Uncharacterized protein n=1 Tax=Enhygromyxa salina TaxID=215803 RepID=A0A2S9Y697_9BACT|nr:hypothetical protein [Enhygromyxa salina]PRQ00531.1 hypothetical protein ENSA7_60250 [Enhygromyxa salina]
MNWVGFTVIFPYAMELRSILVASVGVILAGCPATTVVVGGSSADSDGTTATEPDPDGDEGGDIVDDQRSPQQAIDSLTAAILVQNPGASKIEIVSAQVGYQLAEEETSGEIAPSLLAGYVVAFESGAVISRRVPVRISLIEPDAPVEALGAEDPNPDEGDERAAN